MMIVFILHIDRRLADYVLYCDLWFKKRGRDGDSETYSDDIPARFDMTCKNGGAGIASSSERKDDGTVEHCIHAVESARVYPPGGIVF